MASSDKVVAEFKRDTHDGQVVRAQLSTFKGRQYFGIRAFYYDEEKQDYFPTKNGLHLPVDEFDSVQELINKLNFELEP